MPSQAWLYTVMMVHQAKCLPWYHYKRVKQHFEVLALKEDFFQQPGSFFSQRAEEDSDSVLPKRCPRLSAIVDHLRDLKFDDKPDHELIKVYSMK